MSHQRFYILCHTVKFISIKKESESNQYYTKSIEIDFVAFKVCSFREKYTYTNELCNYKKF